MKKPIFFEIIIAFFLLAALSFHSDAQSSLQSAEEEVSLMLGIRDYFSSNGLGTERISDLITEANLLIESRNFEAVKELSKNAVETKSKAIFALNQTEKAKIALVHASQISNESEYLKSLEKILEKSSLEISSENYESSLALLDSFFYQILQVTKKDFDLLLENLNHSEAKMKELGLQLGIYDDLRKKLLDSYSNDFSAYIRYRADAIIVPSFSRNIVDLKSGIKSLELEGLPSSRVSDMMDESIVLAELGKLQSAVDTSKNALHIYLLEMEYVQKSKEARKELDFLENEGFDASLAEKKFLLSRESFASQDFENSLSLLELSRIEAEKSKSAYFFNSALNKKIKGMNLTKVIRDNIWNIALVLAVFLVMLVPILIFSKKRRIISKINGMKNEEKAIRAMIEKIQVRHFSDRKLSKESYESLMDSYQEKIIKIREDLPVLESRLNGLKSMADSTMKKILFWR